MTPQSQIDRLLYEEEGTTLDFKCEQYRFSEASDDDKSELLKDILAFANAWRRTDAYILVGAKEVKGGRSLVIGITDHLDDAHLQQFINTKTNRPIEFSYRTIEFDGSKLGLFQIPTQCRPFYIKKDFGKLKKNTVYIRRGSSTDIASPDEVVTMGADTQMEVPREPVLEAFFMYGEHDEFQEKHVSCQIQIIKLPAKNEIPDYGSKYQSIGGSFSIRNFDSHTNYDYYRERADFLAAFSKVQGFKVSVRNTGELPARDVKVILDIEGVPSEMTVCKISDLPSIPSPHKMYFPISHFQNNRAPDITIKKSTSGWQIACKLGKIQPQDQISTSDKIFIGVENSQTIKVSGRIYCDDLPSPKLEYFDLAYDVILREISVSELVPSKKPVEDA